MSNTLPVPFKADGTLGALLIGTLVSFTLFGITCAQTYTYYAGPCFAKDPVQMKALVACVWCGEFAHTICIAMSLYTLLITNYGHPERLAVLPNALLASTFIGSLISFVATTFFAYRIYVLSRTRTFWSPAVSWIPYLCWALSLFRFVPPNVIVFKNEHQPIPLVLQRWGPLFDSIWAASAANDLLIAGTLCFLLYDRRSSGSKHTNAMVERLIAWTIETGVVTSLASVATLALFIALPSTFAWLSVFVVIPKLFSNSLLASLNSRASLSSEVPSQHEMSFAAGTSTTEWLVNSTTSEPTQSRSIRPDADVEIGDGHS
ncbi:hypothetical protein R3P38DRAFT_1297185 [Favolaschia claudopus]|uniref:DUF6534 domain-containing protein n=1 Tax=Favolaschia claudopus TaxID=2862362 RepID=A0AAW0AXK7_9AGAR